MPEGQALLWETPVGQLAIDEGGTISALIRTNLRSDEKVTQAVNAVAGLRQEPFACCEGSSRSEGGLTLVWGGTGNARQSLIQLAPLWRESPALYLPRAIAAAQCVSRAIGELQHLAPARFLLSPAQVFVETCAEGRDKWVVAPLPFEAAQLKDIAGAAPATLAWLSGEDLLARREFDRAYMIGAVLHYALVGELFPQNLSTRQRIHRQLAFRAGDALALRAMLAAAVPQALAASARRLGDLVTDALRPGRARPIDAASAVRQLERLARELSPAFLAGAWETDGKPATALAILEDHARTAPTDEVPWATLARLREAMGAQTPGQPSPVRQARQQRPEAAVDGSPRGRLRGLLGQGPEARDALIEEVRRQLDPQGPALDEDQRLFVAYVCGRWLGADAAAQTALSRPCSVSWNAATRAVLLARIHVGRGAWALGAREAKAAHDLVAAMPGGGERRGQYLMAHALLYDAAAHLGFVDAGSSPDYLRDVWTRLKRARGHAAKLEEFSLNAALSRQLGALRDRIVVQPGLADLPPELDAEMTRSFAVANDPGEDERLPWPDEPWLFG